MMKCLYYILIEQKTLGLLGYWVRLFVPPLTMAMLDSQPEAKTQKSVPSSRQNSVMTESDANRP